MSNFQDFDEELARTKLIEKIELAKNCEKEALEALESQFQLMSGYVKFLADDGEYSEILYDLEDEIAHALNDSNFREDRIGIHAANCPDLFRIIYKYMNDDINIEVILASNPNIPEDLTEKLIVSESNWEEDGAQQALARNRREEWILDALSKSDQASARYEVAVSDFTPSHILDSLVDDIDACDWRVQEIKFGEVSEFRGYIRWAVIQNPNTPKSTLNKVKKMELNSINDAVDSLLADIAAEFLAE